MRTVNRAAFDVDNAKPRLSAALRTRKFPRFSRRGGFDNVVRNAAKVAQNIGDSPRRLRLTKKVVFINPTT